jgi:hypothetical protein
MDPKSQDGWSGMTQILRNCGEKNGYVLAASSGMNPSDTFDYYVRKNFNLNSANGQLVTGYRLHNEENEQSTFL